MTVLQRYNANKRILLTISLACGLCVLQPVSAFDSSRGQLERLAQEMSQSVEFDGWKVHVVNETTLKSREKFWLDKIRTFDSSDPSVSQTDLFLCALLCRVLADSVTANRESCQEKVLQIYESELKRYNSHHPGISEIVAQMNIVAGEQNIRNCRIKAAREGCRQSRELIRHDLGVDGVTVVEYFGGIEQALSYALIEMLYYSKEGVKIDTKCDTAPTVFALITRAEPSMVDGSLDVSGVDMLSKMEDSMENANSSWNSRYIPKCPWELDLVNAWKELANRPSQK